MIFSHTPELTITRRFVGDFLIGFSLTRNFDQIITSFKNRYRGASRNSLLACLNAVAKRFNRFRYHLGDGIRIKKF